MSIQVEIRSLVETRLAAALWKPGFIQSSCPIFDPGEDLEGLIVFNCLISACLGQKMV